tara:strand:- start:489 stop:1175 length:687 start_codon:yes stop_codon:yes gene_type:complete
MKLLIIASPKSASTSLMKGLSDITGLNARQEYFSTNKKTHNFNLLARLLNKIFKNLHVVSSEHAESKKLRHVFPSYEFSLLSKFHSDIADFNLDTNLENILKHKIHKQHIPPTKNNLQLLKNTKKIILLRRPEEVLESYLREPFNEDLFYLQEKIKEDIDFKLALLDELNLWVNGWFDAEKQNPNSMIIYYKDLIEKTPMTLNSILNFFEIDTNVDSNYNLPQERYYR